MHRLHSNDEEAEEEEAAEGQGGGASPNVDGKCGEGAGGRGGVRK